MPWCPSAEYQDLYRQCGSRQAEERPGLEKIIVTLRKVVEELDITWDQDDSRSQVTNQQLDNLMPESMLQKMGDLIDFDTDDSLLKMSTVSDVDQIARVPSVQACNMGPVL